MEIARGRTIFAKICDVNQSGLREKNTTNADVDEHRRRRWPDHFSQGNRPSLPPSHPHFRALVRATRCRIEIMQIEAGDGSGLT